MAKTIYCLACGTLNRDLYGQLKNCKACREVLSSDAEIQTPKVVLKGIGRFILRKGLTCQDVASDIKILESNREIIYNARRCVKLQEATTKRIFRDDGTTPLVDQLLRQSMTSEKLDIEKDLSRLRVVLEILRDERGKWDDGSATTSMSSRNLFHLIEKREKLNNRNPPRGLKY